MINVYPVRAFKDNYIWVLHDDVHAIAVDPGISDPVIHYLQTNKLKLVAILVTHHHHDHTGGIGNLTKLFDIPVYGPQSDSIPDVTVVVSESEEILIKTLGLKLTVLNIPGHTREHIAYYTDHPFQGVFCGDTLFACGCGRVFEGTHAQMHASLNKLSQLPNNTLVYCTHEYTLNNIRFAKCVDPENQVLLNFEMLCNQLVTEQRPTLPTTIELEKAINPFLRCDQPAIINCAQNHSKLLTINSNEVFSILRRWKDSFC